MEHSPRTTIPVSGNPAFSAIHARPGQSRHSCYRSGVDAFTGVDRHRAGSSHMSAPPGSIGPGSSGWGFPPRSRQAPVDPSIVSNAVAALPGVPAGRPAEPRTRTRGGDPRRIERLLARSRSRGRARRSRCNPPPPTSRAVRSRPRPDRAAPIWSANHVNTLDLLNMINYMGVHGHQPTGGSLPC